MSTVALATLGCKLNFAESSTLGKQFLDRGYTLVGFGEPADVSVINTCSVTARADRECRQLIRRARRSSPETVVVVTGCYAQLEPEEVASIDGVDFVLGAKEKLSLFDHAGPLTRRRYPHIAVSEIGTVDDFGPAFSSEAGNRTRAFLKVQDGCDYSCSFCTIPLARGASRSLPVDASVRQARELVAAGYREIVLTGVNVGDFGRKSGSGLLELLRELVRIEDLQRIRISSLEPNLLSDDIIDFVASHDVMCKHFHVPLQSGSDVILRAMRRRYTAAFYADRIHALREKMPGCGIGLDVIAGFPGETDADFETTHDFIAGLSVSSLHVFTYSERPKTPAAVLRRPVEPKVRFRRNEILRILGQHKRRSFQEGMIGRRVPVLLEADDEQGTRSGYTDNYVRVSVPAESAPRNAIVTVEITGVKDDCCTGVVRGGNGA